MSDIYRLAADRGPTAQLALGLEVRLDPPGAVHELTPGDRFFVDGLALEGKVVSRGSGSVTVAVLDAAGRWVRTTWSPNTVVRRMRG
ncbi:MAG: hypothetical protein KF785_16460 [Gemmatimonadales bacterium]|nr:hypothetical protein [Gemmatimonadales bacterium]